MHNCLIHETNARAFSVAAEHSWEVVTSKMKSHLPHAEAAPAAARYSSLLKPTGRRLAVSPDGLF